MLKIFIIIYIAKILKITLIGNYRVCKPQLRTAGIKMFPIPGNGKINTQQ